MKIIRDLQINFVFNNYKTIYKIYCFHHFEMCVRVVKCKSITKVLKLGKEIFSQVITIFIFFYALKESEISAFQILI